MNANNSTPKDDLESKTGSKESKWTFWPSFLLLLFTINVVILLLTFIIVDGLVDKVGEVVPVVWGAFTTLIAFLGIKKAKETTWLSLLRLLPTGMIIIFYTIISILFVSYSYLTLVQKHYINVTATLNSKPQEAVQIIWDKDSIGITLENGKLPGPIKTIYGTHKLKAIFGSYTNTKNVDVDRMWEFEQHDTITLSSTDVDSRANGTIFIQAKIDGEKENGVRITIEKTGEVYQTPDTVELSAEEHTIIAEIKRYGRLYYKKSPIEIKVGPNIGFTIPLEMIKCFANTLKISAVYIGAVNQDTVHIKDTATIIINNIKTYHRELPTSIDELEEGIFDVKVVYLRGENSYEGSSQIRLDCEETKSVVVSVERKNP